MKTYHLEVSNADMVIIFTALCSMKESAESERLVEMISALEQQLRAQGIDEDAKRKVK